MAWHERPLPRATAAVVRPVRELFAFMTPEQPLELQIVGRTLWHAALVGLAAGALGCLFFAASDLLFTFALERLAGYEPLRAHGERVWNVGERNELRLWMVLVIPALGAFLAGWVTRFAPECRGGGGDATIAAFHRKDGVLRPRVLWVKPVASVLTLGSGGSGGREGPTMLIGGALGSFVARVLRVSPRERRALMVAGVAAGISAVFRTPLGAALIAIEMLYRDDFESEAFIPAVLASVVAYSISISVFGESTMFGHLAPHTFHPKHIPLYVALALLVAGGATAFLGSMRLAHRLFARLPGPDWVRPAFGGLALGLFVILLIHVVGPLVGRPDRGVGGLGGGYGAAQVAITGSDWIPAGWNGVQLLFSLAFAKVITTSLTLGSGGSAGDFAPSLAIGALIGGAFGLAAQLVLGDPSIQPGAFALVGMGAFYGGVAKTPLAALVLVCEMAGSYDLLVPLMLAVGVAFVALRRISLYSEQVATLRDSPVHKREADPLQRMTCGDVLRRDRAFVTLAPEMDIRALAHAAEAAADQDVFPVVSRDGALRGLIAAEALRVVASNPELHQLAIVADMMRAAASVTLDQDLRAAALLMVSHDLRSLPVIDPSTGVIAGLLDEHDIASAALGGRPADV